jgi:two-component system, OmpR family, KDP operon response regulator KdpE
MPTRTKAHKARILVVTAEPQIQKLLKSIFTANGYRAFFAADAAAAVRTNAALRPELVVLDRDLSDLSGDEAILGIRRHYDVPMIVLSGERAEADLVAALDLGADDYVEKPFRPSELLARIRSVLRRSFKARGEEAIYRRGDLLVDILDHKVTCGGEPIRLTPTEFEILSLLVRSSGRVVPYQRFVDSLSDAKHCRSRQALRASIWSLRQKIEKTPDDPKIVLTEERIGYRLATDPLRPPC